VRKYSRANVCGNGFAPPCARSAAQVIEFLIEEKDKVWGYWVSALFFLDFFGTGS